VRIVCPLCKRVIADAPADFGPRPFCSARCKLADLNNWLTESYRISSPLAVSDHGEDDGGHGASPSALPRGKYG
jgi:endogenous inhibitor of DNA gyrase (YacG/DUF329 family)